MNVVIVTFYKFVRLSDYQEIQPKLLELCQTHDIYGTILLAEEGINATIAGSREGIDTVLAHLRADARMSDLLHKESFTDFIPFDRLKVRLKKEIVRLKVDGIDPNQAVGTYIEPEDWNALISDPEVLVIDTRNHFEIGIGSFKGAISPKTAAFHDFPEYVQEELDPKTHKKIAMFCTGGIRCEKATGFMLQQGFEEIYHLNGGILRYLEHIPPEESLWEGECFVFDKRVSVDHHLQPGKSRFCEQCKALLAPDTNTCPSCGSTS